MAPAGFEVAVQANERRQLSDRFTDQNGLKQLDFVVISFQLPSGIFR
jgi:hypothetical protein